MKTACSPLALAGIRRCAAGAGARRARQCAGRSADEEGRLRRLPRRSTRRSSVPAYVDVAAKYKGDKDAAAKLAKKVKEGGSGVWGPIPMPPNAAVSDADIKDLVAWILTLKK